MKNLIAILLLSLPFAVSAYASFFIPNLAVTTPKVGPTAITAAKILPGTITTTQIASNAAITHPQLAVRTGATPTATTGNVAVNVAGSLTFSTSSGTPLQITNSQVTITTNGSPIMIFMIPTSAATAGGLVNSTGGCTVYLYKEPGSSISGAGSIATWTVTGISNYSYPSSMVYVDVTAAGTYTYGYFASCSSGALNVFNQGIVAYEL